MGRASGEVGLEDERLMLADPAQATAAVEDWAGLGVDIVRIHARWAALAPRRAKTAASTRPIPTTRCTSGRRSTTPSAWRAAPG